MQMIELVERPAVRLDPFGGHYCFDVIAVRLRSFMVDFQGFQIESFDPLGDRLSFAFALFFFRLQFVQASSAGLQGFVTLAQIADARRRHGIAEAELLQRGRPFAPRVL